MTRSELPPEGRKATNELGMQVLVLPFLQGDAFSLDVPIPTDPVYHAQLRGLLRAINDGLALADPNATRVTSVGFTGPSMISIGMRVLFGAPYFAAAGDSYGFGWTYQGHLAAFAQFAEEYGGYREFAKRVWTWDLVDGTAGSGLVTSDQAAITAILQSAHPAGENGVIVRNEALAVSYATSSATWRGNYAKTEAYPLRYVATHPRHAWELWTPFSSRGYPEANLPYQDLLVNSLRLDPWDETAAYSGTLWVEGWLADLAEPSADLDAFLSDWDVQIRLHAARP